MTKRSLDNVFAELRRLNEPVPRALTLPSEEAVNDVEEQIGVRLHADLRRYLLESSDVVFGTIQPITIGGGHTDLVSVLSDAREWGVPDDLFPICEDNADFYCLAPSGEVVFWSHNGVTDERWEDLATWIDAVWIHTASRADPIDT